jgi:ubiquinone/menaquinone biosynthesis C-methylase UbiE
LRAFFHERADEIAGVPTIEDLCFVSGREPRLWTDPEMRADLAASIVAGCGADQASNVLEVGCAAGYLAQLVAPRVGRYTGIDLADAPLRIARRLGLGNAIFRKADGAKLPFADGVFDAAFCYDVYTNFPRFEDGAGLIRDMLRVVKPGGRVLVGSIPDSGTEADYVAHVGKVLGTLETRYGPVRQRPAAGDPGFLARLRRRWSAPSAKPEIVCYYFRQGDFRDLGRELDVPVEVADIHARNPYAGYRFNAIYRKPA